MSFPRLTPICSSLGNRIRSTPTQRDHDNMIFLLVGHNEKNVSLLTQGVHFLLLDAPRKNDESCGVTIETLLIPEQSADTHHWFQELSAALQKSLDRGSLTVLVSHVRPHCLNPLVSSGWESVLAMLILAFPDVRWMFGTVHGYDEANEGKVQDLDKFRSEHG